MTMALDDAHVDPTEIGYVNAHATSTPLGDSAETRVIKLALGEEHAKKVAVSSTKGATGHCFGAAGSVEAVFSVLAVRDRIAPPTINYDESGPGMRPRLRPERPARAARADDGAVELVRLRRPQRDHRHAPLGGLKPAKPVPGTGRVPNGQLAEEPSRSTILRVWVGCPGAPIGARHRFSGGSRRQFEVSVQGRALGCAPPCQPSGRA